MYFIMNENITEQHASYNSLLRKEWIFRLFATPFFAIFVSNITPLVYPRIDSTYSLLINYTYFTILVHLLWVGNRWIVYNLRKGNYWIKNPVIKSIAIFFIHMFFSFILAFVLHYIWNVSIAQIPVPINNIFLASFIATILSIMVATLYEIVLLTRERRTDILESEKLSLDKVQAELETLKSQIDPHFIFNSLNTLSELISDDREKALLFNENLAKVYRYILYNRSADLVTVKEEVDFINSYLLLLKIRFENTLNITTKIGAVDLTRYYLPTIAIQTAIENAIKHNQFSGSCPLSISIEITNDYAIIANNKNPVRYKTISSGTGLTNLDNRYKLILNKSIHIDETIASFTIYLPVVKK
jgi:two-component system, LytTR family, sensor kinase